METCALETVRTTSATAFVPEYRVEELRRTVEAIGRRAAKLGVAAPVLHLTGAEDSHTVTVLDGQVLAIPLTIRMVEVVVIGETPKLPGWKLVAVVSHEDGLVDVVPGETCPVEQRSRGPVCDHCKRTDPRRRKTMVLRSDTDGSIVQVGTTCIGDFLGATAFDPIAALRLAQAIFASVAGCGFDEADLVGGRATPTVELESVLCLTAGWLVANPWVSGAKARESVGAVYPTSTYIRELLFPGSPNPDYLRSLAATQAAVTDEHKAEIAAALAWVAVEAEKPEASDYILNLGLLVESGVVASRRVGYACSILPTYRRAVERQKADAAAASQYVGSVGDKVTLIVTLAAEPRVVGAFGAHLTKLVDAQGNVFTWFASSRIDAAVGERIAIKATIKAHTEFRGSCETQITRGTLLATKPVEVDAIAALIAGPIYSAGVDYPVYASLAARGVVKYGKRAKVWKL